MSRRDTIVVAVLINMGLLIVLFVGALKSDPTLEIESARVEKNISKEVTKEIKPPTIDQVDTIIDQIVDTSSKPKVVAVEPVIKKEETIVKPVEPEKVPEYIEVVVKQGDVLEKLARTYQVSVSDIQKINQLSDTRLRIGQVLHFPKVVGSEAALQEKYYTVKNGDNPWTIAIKNQIKVEELLRLNELNDEKAKRLKPGDQLRIR